MRLFTDVASRIDDPWLRRAFILAESGRGSTSPNPLVGCVIVREGEVVGEGFHERAGCPHAEVIALDRAGDAAADATAYVTLEPCTHHGRTPPCTDALRAARVARVVIGMRDPNATVSGDGVEALRTAGVDVALAQDATPFEIQNEAWLASLELSRPFVRVKLALSLDGRLALEPGRRAAITGPSGAQVTSTLRARADAVLVGGATVAADDPSLTARGASGALAARQPLRVVLVRERIPVPTARVFADDEVRTLLLAPHALAAEASRQLPSWVEFAGYDGGLGLTSALRTLSDVGVVDLLVEAGPTLFSALWDAGLVDELIAVQAGGVAGADAPSTYLGSACGPPDHPDTLDRRMAPLECGIVGDVAVNVWRPARSPARQPPEGTRR